MRILLAEDSPRLQELLAETLRAAGYGLDTVGTVADLLATAAAVTYDLMIVDLGLPDGDGLDAIRVLRTQGKATPILIITARGTIDQRVAGLDSGADDYMIKPFNNAELLARVRALLRRPADVSGPKISVGNTVLDDATGEFRCNENVLDLRPSERRLLTVMIRRAGTLVPKGVLETSLSEFRNDLSANAIEALVSRARKALTEAGSDAVIETVRGIGYLLKDKNK
jgi:DNA-binding response OmpR family regulator